MLELDELWSFVYRRRDKRWVWLALCRRTRQIVAFAVGDRGAETCKRLWRRVPPSYRRLLCFTDFWDAYAKVIPETQHEATDKGDGQGRRPDVSCRALEQHLAAAAGAVRAPDALLQQERPDAQGLLAAVRPRLQPGPVARRQYRIDHYHVPKPFPLRGGWRARATGEDQCDCGTAIPRCTSRINAMPKAIR